MSVGVSLYSMEQLQLTSRNKFRVIVIFHRLCSVQSTAVVKFSRNGVPPPVSGVPPPEIAVPPPTVVVPPPIFRAVIIAKLTYAASALERLHQCLRSSAYWRSHSPGKALRLLWLWITTVWWTVRQCWRTTIRQCTKNYEETLTIRYIIFSPHRTIVSVAVRTIVNYQNILIISMTVILSSVCFIKIKNM